ncbi:unnamed protein product [Heterobilharzia americana]|nr:unnamed protein product [Heterobilharzia americana]CAH8454090.1 unnamed protein product [Heterobilharzia americana]
MPIPNVYMGTECGEIREVNISLIGRRVVHKESFGTICYVGELPNSKDFWLGVNWDDASRGRHDGTYNGVRYFQTKNPTSGSFVKPSKVSLGTSLEEALVYRYAVCARCQLEAQITLCSNEKPEKSLVNEMNQPSRLDAYLDDTFATPEAEYSGNSGHCLDAVRVELYTTPRINQNEISNSHSSCGASAAKFCLSQLKSVSLSFVPVYRALHWKSDCFPDHHSERSSLWPSTGGCIGQFLTNICDLELSNCLLSKWTEIAEMCIQIPWLKSLNVSNNCIRLPVSPTEASEKCNANGCLESRLLYDVDSDPVLSEQLCSNAFPQLSQLTLVRCSPLDWKCVRRIVCWMPCLRSLSLAYNNLGNPSCDWEEVSINAFRRLIELDLTHINLTSAYQLFTLIGPSKNLQTLFLNCNEISDLPDVIDSGGSPWFQNLSTLGLRKNLFTNWNYVNQLLHLSKLRHLMASECPIFERSNNKEIARQEVIARLPNLKILDRVEITPEERRGAELDYLKRYGASWLHLNKPDHTDENSSSEESEKFHRLHPVFARLCDKYGAPEIGETKLVTRSIKEGLISVIFVLQRDSSKTTKESSSQLSLDNKDMVEKQIPDRMTIKHLRMMIRRLFHLSPKTLFELYAQVDGYHDMNMQIPLDLDTREIGFYNLENGDHIFVRIQ